MQYWGCSVPVPFPVMFFAKLTVLLSFCMYGKKLEAYLRTEKVKKLMLEFWMQWVLSKILYSVSGRYREHME